MTALLVFGLCVQIIGPYTIWFDRRNIAAHQSAGFIMIAYIIPGLFTDFGAGFSAIELQLYVWTSVLGGIAFVGGLQLSRMYSPRKPWLLKIAAHIKAPDFAEKLGRRISVLLIFSITALVLAYLLMGFIPMFAADPLSAKQFKGAYREPYLRAALFFRTGLVVAVFIMPIAAVYAFTNKRRVFIAGVLILAILILVSLAKGAAAAWLITVLGVFATKKRRYVLIYLIFVIGLNFVGAIFYYLLAQVSGIATFGGGEAGTSFAALVAAGAPDMTDQLTLISAFLDHGSSFTYGRTFVGGLVPFSYEWNPAVWTLNVINDGVDITELASGGLRLPASLWGYFSFGWLGVLLVPLISGWILGCCIQAARYVLAAQKGFLSLMLVSAALLSVAYPLASFYVFAIYYIPPLALSWFIFLPHRRIRLY